MKAIALKVEPVEYITISAAHATEMYNEKIELYLNNGWRKHQDQPENNKGLGFKVNLYKPGHELKLATALGPNINEYDEFIHALLREKHSGFEPILTRSEKPNHLEIVIMKKSEPKVFEKPDIITENFVSNDEPLKEEKPKPKHSEKSQYIYFEDGDPVEVTNWANSKYKEGYTLIGGIEPKLFTGHSHTPLFIYHATMELK